VGNLTTTFPCEKTEIPEVNAQGHATGRVAELGEIFKFKVCHLEF
jgi:hypothetical protein